MDFDMRNKFPNSYFPLNFKTQKMVFREAQSNPNIPFSNQKLIMQWQKSATTCVLFYFFVFSFVSEAKEIITFLKKKKITIFLLELTKNGIFYIICFIFLKLKKKIK